MLSKLVLYCHHSHHVQYTAIGRIPSLNLGTKMSGVAPWTTEKVHCWPIFHSLHHYGSMKKTLATLFQKWMKPPHFVMCSKSLSLLISENIWLKAPLLLGQVVNCLSRFSGQSNRLVTKVIHDYLPQCEAVKSHVLTKCSRTVICYGVIWHVFDYVIDMQHTCRAMHARAQYLFINTEGQHLMRKYEVWKNTCFFSNNYQAGQNTCNFCARLHCKQEISSVQSFK